ncbi:MAG: HEAT repeat domain-containing protein, partial [Planctomycetes bacterium]|nr:HEAT repeat domain-containing protein [Planctomycetota bacterium]
MLKIFLPLLSLVAAGLVFAQEAPEKGPTPEEAIVQLGSESYEVREGATRRLVEMGERALPALEKALQSEDVEVRMRAGRALRAIRDGKERKESTSPLEREGAPSPAIQHRGYSIQMQDGRVKVQVKEVVDGEERTREYEGESLEQLKRDHPELEGVLGGFRLQFGNGLRPDPKQELDPFWGGRLQGLDEDFWKDLQREQQRTEELLARMQEQR